MKSRRKKHFVDPAVQGALIRRLVLHWLIFLTMTFFTLPLWRIWSTGNIFTPFPALMIESWEETAPVFLVLIAMLPIFVWDTVKLSHCFAGPMYRFQRTIQDLAAGEEVRPIRLRKGDFWTGFAEDLNRMMERLAAERRQDAPETGEPTACAAASGDAAGKR